MAAIKRKKMANCCLDIKRVSYPKDDLIIDTMSAVWEILDYKSPQPPEDVKQRWIQTYKFLERPSVVDDLLTFDSKNLTSERARKAKEWLSLSSYEALCDSPKYPKAASFFFKWASDHVDKAELPPSA